ncbi:gap junction alpha-4 protein-like [Scleropages formosus]|uniref:Gap junction protein n=1 Tax=Scleropages formosus TaxID=113540 RepID=A0A0P7XAJ0_SCLFO|nr:gap junction alpha-4 protein-like [Scleropages formosus]XP_018615408.1 gap junction alpha-4 protein-like [Scleropages formosus]XP_018615409.1 gap junction alpha-4 protein-like [Scleropages formosus]KPP73406.1 gap junction alpha-4 protein-like [Scleropages formosus]
MSKADWSFLERVLEDGQEHSTAIGRVWLMVLFLFRILVLGTAAESTWDDEQSDFFCNTAQPGCETVCYDKAFPISHFRYFVLQVIFVSTPTAFYFGYVALRSRRKIREKEKEQVAVIVLDGGDSNGIKVADKKGGKEEPSEQVVVSEIPKLKGGLLCAYTASICTKLLLEVGFMVGMWILYGFILLPRFVCERDPCPHLVDCFVSRPTEKTIFTIYMQVIAAISVVLNIMELLYLVQRAIIHCLEKKYNNNSQKTVCMNLTPTGLQVPGLFTPTYQDQSKLPLPNCNVTYTQPYKQYPPMETWAIPDEGMSQGKPVTPLPSYSNCVNPGRSSTTRSGSEKSSHKGHAKSSRRDKSRPRQYV